MTKQDEMIRDWNDYIQMRHKGTSKLIKINFTTWKSEFENIHDFIFEIQLFHKAKSWFDDHFLYLYKNEESSDLYETFYFVFYYENNSYYEIDVTKNYITREYIVDVYVNRLEFSGFLTKGSIEKCPEPLSSLARTLVTAVVDALKTKMTKERANILLAYKIVNEI
jgi:hypothetical protein